MALFGTSYLASARNTISLLHSTAVESATANALVTDVIGMGSFVGALLTGALAAVLAFAVYQLPLIVGCGRESATRLIAAAARDARRQCTASVSSSWRS